MERLASDSLSYVKRKWRHINIHGAEYIISASAEANSWKILLSNLVEIWTETITKDIALSRCQSLNLLLDLDSFNLEETLGGMLNNIPNHVTDSSVDEIKLETCIDGIAFKFTINLAKGNAQQFWNEITKPMCQSTMELQHRQEMLLDLIRKKDEELTEYKLGGAQLTRKNIETQPFNQDIFRNEICNRCKKSKDCINEFIFMMDLYEDSKICESCSNNDRPRVSQDPGFSRLDPLAPGIKTENEDAEASETLLAVNGNIHESRSRLETEPGSDTKPLIRESSSIAEVTKECKVSRTLQSTNESKIDSKTEKQRKKRSTLNDMANAPSASIEQPKKRPKGVKSIYDLIA